jgi:thiol-disulfide isomerase/thioredoxin
MWHKTDRDHVALGPLLDEAEGLLVRARGEFGDVRGHDQYNDIILKRGTVGAAAGRELFEMHELVIGKPAPEIEGEDIDGRPMKLSDYRGKVVVLEFWGDWCGYCREMYPQGRSLVERLKGKPFALLGINSDRDRARLKEGVEAEQVTWRSWWDGGSTAGPIASRWNIQGWPALFVLDGNGVIRHRDVRGKALDEAVDSLLRETER